MPVSIKGKGLGRAKKLLKTIKKLGGAIKAAELNAKAREGSDGLDNAQVLDYLAESGRDFVTLSDTEQEEMSGILIDELTEGIKKVKEADNPEKKAKNVAAKAFIAAALYWQKKITEHIEEQKWIGDGGDLNEDYASTKEKKYGFRKPIGVATGQVKDNVAPSKRNIRLKK